MVKHWNKAPKGFWNLSPLRFSGPERTHHWAWSQGCPNSEQDFGVDKLLKSLAPWMILWLNLSLFFPSHFSPQPYRNIFLMNHFLKQWSWWDPSFPHGLSTLLECERGKAGPLPWLNWIEHGPNRENCWPNRENCWLFSWLTAERVNSSESWDPNSKEKGQNRVLDTTLSWQGPCRRDGNGTGIITAFLYLTSPCWTM